MTSGREYADLLVIGLILTLHACHRWTLAQEDETPQLQLPQDTAFNVTTGQDEDNIKCAALKSRPTD